MLVAPSWGSADHEKHSTPGRLLREIAHAGGALDAGASVDVKFASLPNGLIDGFLVRLGLPGCLRSVRFWSNCRRAARFMSAASYGLSFFAFSRPPSIVRRGSFAATHKARAGSATAVARNGGPGVKRSNTGAPAATPSVW